MIEFTSKIIAATLLDPRNGFAPTTVEAEIRSDPLTGDTGRLAHFGMISPQKEDLSGWDTPEARQRCPFCPPNIQVMTPKFPPYILPEGHLKLREATVICNISPYDQYSALTVMSSKHLVPLNELAGSILKDAFQAGLEFCKIVAGKEGLPYYIIAWNYMPPSGGGLIHPHQQVIATDAPGNLYRKVMEGSMRYYRRYGKNFWEDLCLEEQKRGERYIGKVGRGTWLVPYVPLGVLGEFMAVFPGVNTIYDLDEEVLGDLVGGLERLFAYFDSLGIYSFNMGLYFAPLGREEKEKDAVNYFSLHARVIPRTFLNLKQKPPDTNVFHMVLQEPFCVIPPEKHCQDLKTFFEK